VCVRVCVCVCVTLLAGRKGERAAQPTARAGDKGERGPAGPVGYRGDAGRKGSPGSCRAVQFILSFLTSAKEVMLSSALVS